MHHRVIHRVIHRPMAFALGLALLALATGLPPSATAAPSATTAAVSSPLPGVLVPVTPFRALDTRARIGVPTTTPAASLSTTIVTVAGRGSVPATGVAAVVATLTVTGSATGGFLSAWSGKGARPSTSVLSFSRDNVATSSVITLDQGRLALFNGSSSSAHLLVDVTGWIPAGATTAPGTYHPITPTRLYDTRETAGPLPSGASAGVSTFAGGAVPGDGVAAVVVTITVTGGTSSGWVRAGSGGSTSSVNWRTGQTVANLAVVEDENGYIPILNGSGGSVHVIVDISGYVTAGNLERSGSWRPLVGRRVLDTRTPPSGGVPVPAGGTLTLPLGAGGVLPPSGVGLLLGNVTVTGGSADGYLTAYPTGSARPTTSVLNWRAGQTVAAAAAIPAGANGSVSFYNGSSRPVSLIVDSMGLTLANDLPAVSGASTSRPGASPADVASRPEAIGCTTSHTCFGAYSFLIPGRDSPKYQGVISWLSAAGWAAESWGGTARRVACTGAELCVSTEGGTGATEHRSDGWHYTPVLAPPMRMTSPWFYAVACPDEHTCIGAGRVRGSGSPAPDVNQAATFLREDGKNAPITILSPPAGYAKSQLTDISCGAPTSCEAVGWISDAAGTLRPLVAHYDLSSWQQTVIDRPGSTFDKVACSRDRCVAAGPGPTDVSADLVLTHSPTSSTWAAEDWQPVDAAADAAVTDVACAGGTCSLSVDLPEHSAVVRVDDEGSTLEVVTATPGASLLAIDSISCIDADRCVAFGPGDLTVTDRGVVAMRTASGWTSAVLPALPGGSEEPTNDDVTTGEVTCLADGWCAVLSTSVGRYGVQSTKATTFVAP